MTRPRRRPPTCRPVARPAVEPLETRAYFATGLTFGAVTPFAAGPNPTDVVTADMNGDGKADVVVANYGSAPNAIRPGSPGTGGVSVLLGTGTATAKTGAFNAPRYYPVNTPIQSIAVADLNGDGHPDVVGVGVGEPYVYVWLNNGDGTLGTPTAYPVGTNPEGVAIADVNGDGIPDIITANQGMVGKGSVSVLIGQGNGTFAPAVSYDGGPNPDALAVGDVNGDSYPDIVTVDPENDELHVLLNTGAKGTTTKTTNTDGTVTITDTGQFPATNTEYATDLTGRAVTIVDVNNDAYPDLVVANLRASNVGVLLNNGDGTFKDATTYGVGGFPFSVTSADLNGDNRAELITADSRDNAVGVLVHNAMGGFNTGGGTGQHNNGTNEPRQFLTGSSPEAVAVANLITGDPRPDLITADFNANSIGVLINNTVFPNPPPAATTITVTPSLTTVASGGPLTLTATVLVAPPASDPSAGPTLLSTAYPGGRVVQFLSGDHVLGVAKLAADGTSTITTHFTLAKGATAAVSEPITVRYNGNAHYANSAVNTAVLVQPKTIATPLVAPTAVAITSRAGRFGGGSTTLSSVPLPAAPAAVTPTKSGVFVAPTAVALVAQSTTPFVPGDAGAVAVTITNDGMVRATGSVTVSLAAVSIEDPATVVQLATVGSATFGIDVRPGYATVVPVEFQLPATLAAGSYNISATLSKARASFAADQVDTASSATAAPAAVVSVLVPLSPGDTGTAAVTITNQGPGQPRNGSVTVSLSITSVDDPTVTLALPIVGSDTFAVNLIGGASRTVSVRFTVPASLAAGDYTVSAVLAASTNLAPDEVDAAPATTVNPTTIITAFGRVPSGRLNPTVTAALPNGSTVNITLTGPGTGTLTVTGDSADLTLANTSAATTLTVTPVGTVPAVLTSIMDNYRLGTINAPGVTLAGDAVTGTPAMLSLATGVNAVTLAGVSDADIDNGPRGHAALSLGTVADTALSSASALQSLTVNSWSQTAGDAIDAPGILGALTSAGDFGATMVLSGAGLPVTLGSASIGGTLDSPTWLLGTGTGAISVGGNLDSDEIIAGARPMLDVKTGSTYYVFNAARIASVTVGGNVIGSFVAAGYRPTTDVNPPFDPTGGTVLPGGSIGAITVAGTTDAASRFAAASLPTIG